MSTHTSYILIYIDLIDGNQEAERGAQDAGGL